MQEFIKKVLTRKEWGYIGILRKDKKTIFGDPNCEYKNNNLLSFLPDEYLNKIISEVSASGGWSRMDYLIKLE